MNISYFNRIVTGKKTWINFVIVEAREQSKQWMHTDIHQASPKNSKKHFQAKNDCYSAFGAYKIFDDWIHKTREHNNIRNLLWIAEDTSQINLW